MSTTFVEHFEVEQLEAIRQFGFDLILDSHIRRLLEGQGV